LDIEATKKATTSGQEKYRRSSLFSPVTDMNRPEEAFHEAQSTLPDIPQENTPVLSPQSARAEMDISSTPAPSLANDSQIGPQAARLHEETETEEGIILEKWSHVGQNTWMQQAERQLPITVIVAAMALGGWVIVKNLWRARVMNGVA